MQISGKKGFAACVLAAAFVVLTALSAACEAAVQTIEATGVYVMGEGPLPSVEDIARCYRLIELTAVLFTVIVVFPLCALVGVHVQIICEDSVMGLIRGF